MPEIQLGHAEPTWFHGLTRILPPWFSEFSLVTLFIVALLSFLAWRGTRNMQKKNIEGRQALSELLVQAFADFTESILGDRGRPFIPLLGTLFLFILTMNLFGLVPGFISPTASLNTTLALALMVFVLVQVVGIRSQGLKHYVMHFVGEPVVMAPLMFPLHLIGELTKPISLALRLGGNIFAEDSVILIIAGMSPTVYLFVKAHWASEVPIFPMQILILPLMILFAAVQAFVFTMLTAIYISSMLGEEHGSSHA